MIRSAGRESIVSILDKHMTATLQGASGCVIVDGPIGIGKTHLLKAVALDGAERGLAVVAGRANVTQQPIPLHLLLNFLRHVSPGRADFADLARPGANLFWLMDRIGELVESAVREQPLVVVLDDAQRIDDAGALALRQLVQALSASPVLWLLARRPVPAQSLARHAIDWLVDHAATRLYLDALDSTATAEFCAGVLGARPDPTVLAWADRCGGNPWLMHNVFNALIKAGQMIIAGGLASVVVEQLPDGVAAVVGSLLSELSPPAQRLLVDGSRLGATFTVDEAVAMLSQSVPDPAAAVAEAVDVGMLHRDGRQLAYAHQIVREAVQHATYAEWEAAAALPAALPSALPAIHEAPRPVVLAGCGCEDLTAHSVSGLMQRFDGVPALLGRALRLLGGAGRATEAGRIADAVLHRGTNESDRGELRHALAEVSRRTTEEPHRCGRERPLWTWLVRAIVAADGFEEAAALLDFVKRETLADPLWYAHRAEMLLAAGRVDEARADAEAALRLAERSSPADSTPARLVLARVGMHRGDLATASDQLRMAERLIDECPADRTRLDWALAQFHGASGRPAMAVATLMNLDDRVLPDALLFCEVPPAAAALVRLSRQAGLTAEADRAAELSRWLADRNPAALSLAGAADHAEGVLRDDAIALQRAAEAYRRARRSLAVGSALEDASRAEERLGDTAAAVRLLDAAAGAYLESGAPADAGRVDRKLLRLDAHNPRRTDAERPKSGWESLTTAELRVVRAIVDGRTNREAARELFLSPHTVDSHLRRVFSKLDINSRVELTKHFIAHA